MFESLVKEAKYAINSNSRDLIMVGLVRATSS